MMRNSHVSLPRCSNGKLLVLLLHLWQTIFQALVFFLSLAAIGVAEEILLREICSSSEMFVAIFGGLGKLDRQISFALQCIRDICLTNGKAWSYMEPLSRSCSSGASKTFCSLWRRLTSTEAACDAQRFRGSINYFKYSQSHRKVKGKLTNSIEQLNKYSINIAK